MLIVRLQRTTNFIFLLEIWTYYDSVSCYGRYFGLIDKAVHTYLLSNIGMCIDVHRRSVLHSVNKTRTLSQTQETRKILERSRLLKLKTIMSSTCCPILPKNEPVNAQQSAPYLLIENNNNKNNIKLSLKAKFWATIYCYFCYC